MAVTFLRQGSLGPEVIDLQFLLVDRGKISQAEVGSADGNFGAKTKAAVTKFQGSKGLVQDGEVGPKTWAALAVEAEWPNKKAGEFLREGDTGEGVKALQNGLRSKQFNVVVDGIFGPRTKAAVIEIQTPPSVTHTNTQGVVGPFTFGGAIGD